MKSINKYFLKISIYGVFFIAFYFLWKILFDNWNKIKDYEYTLNFYYLTLSVLVLMWGQIYLALVWRKLLIVLDAKIIFPRLLAVKIYTEALLSRYAPGKVWSIVNKIYLFISSLYDNVLSLLTTAVLGIVLLALSLGNGINKNYYILSLIMIGGIILTIYPKIFYSAFNFCLKRIKREGVSDFDQLTHKELIIFFLYYFASSVLRMSAFFFLAKSVVDVGYDLFPIIVGAYSMATAIGVVIIFLPGGIGAKEGAIVFLLKSVIPTTTAVIISIFARLWQEFAIILLFFITWGINYFKNKYKKKTIDSSE